MKCPSLKHVGAVVMAALISGLPGITRGDYSSTVLGLNPITYHHFDETTSVPGNNLSNLGTAGLAGTGSIQNAPSQQVTGALVGSSDTAMQFIAGNFSYVGVPQSTAINPSANNATAPFTIEAWLSADTEYALGSGSLGCAISYAQVGSPREGWILYQSENGWNLRMYNHVGTGLAANITGGGPPTAGAWYHMAAVYDGTNVVMYINGTNAAQSAAPGFYPAVTPRILTMGLRSSFDFPWSGRTDEVVLYTNTLSPAEVLAHYQNGTNATPSPAYETLVLAQNPLLYYRMNDAALAGAPIVSPNVGSLGNAADANYDPGSVSGLPGVPYGGFIATNHAVQFNGLTADVMIPPLTGVITNQFTLTCWLQYNNTPGGGGTPIMWQRNGGDNTSSAMGLNFWDGLQLFTMWNDQDYGVLPTPAAVVPIGGWTFLATVWTPTNTTIYVNGVACTLNNPNHVDRDFGIGPILLGNDIYNGVTVNGLLDEVATFNYALSPAQIQSLYNASLAPPRITNLTRTPGDPVFEGQNVSMTVSAFGPSTLTYQWRKGGSALSGRTTSTLSLTNVTSAGNGGLYDVVVSNGNGSVTSSVVNLVIQSGPPVILAQPQPSARFNGAAASFSVSVGGTIPITNQWYFNGTAIPGATGTTLMISQVTAANAGNYSVRLTNGLGFVISSNALLTIVAPGSSYASAAIALGPTAYWRLGETNGTLAFDYSGGRTGVISGGLTQAIAGASSPTFPGLEANNLAYHFNGTDSRVGALPLNINNSAATFVALVKREGTQTSAAVILNERLGADVFQLGMQGDGLSLQYDWADDPATYLFDPGLSPMESQWAFVALSVSATNTTMYLDDSGGGGLQSGVNAIPAVVLPLASAFNIGSDPAFGTSRTWNGGIDEVAVYPRALSDAEVRYLHYVLYNGPVLLTLNKSGTDVTLTWSIGTLQSASTVTGPWTDVSGPPTSPYTTPATGTQFFRVRVY